MRIAKTKALISFAFTAKLICVFVFANAVCWFSHEVAHILILMEKLHNNNIFSFQQCLGDPKLFTV